MCLSAWRRISIHYPMILSFWEDLKTSMSISVKFMYLQVQGFVVAITGAIMTMPGLPKKPAAEGIDVTTDGVITGLF